MLFKIGFDKKTAVIDFDDTLCVLDKYRNL